MVLSINLKHKRQYAYTYQYTNQRYVDAQI